MACLVRSTAAVDNINYTLRKDSSLRSNPCLKNDSCMTRFSDFLGLTESSIFCGVCSSNAAARDAVGTCCHLAKKCGWIQCLVKTQWQFFAVFSASRNWIQLKLSHVTWILSFFIIFPINQHYVDINQSMTLLLEKHRIKFVEFRIYGGMEMLKNHPLMLKCGAAILFSYQSNQCTPNKGW